MGWPEQHSGVSGLKTRLNKISKIYIKINQVAYRETDNNDET